MRQLKFLKTVFLEGKPIWYKDCCYDIIEEGTNNLGRRMYKLFGEDLVARGIDASLAEAGSVCKIIVSEDKKVKDIKENILPETENKPVEIKSKNNSNKSHNKKNKSKK